MIVIFIVDYTQNPRKIPFVSQPRPNSAFNRTYKKVGELGAGACGLVIKVVKIGDPNGK